MNKCLLLVIFSILVYIGRGSADKAQDLLKSLDLEEIVDKLEEYDLDNDGQLSEMEVELQQPGIQKYLDRYAELLKAEEEEEDEEDTDIPPPKNAQRTAQNKETKGQQKTQTQTLKEAQRQGTSHGKDQARQDSVPPTSKSQQKQDGQKNEQKVQAPDSPAVIEAVEDEDDGVEIEVIEEMVFIEDDDMQDYSRLQFYGVIVGSVLGFLSLIFVLCSRAKAERQARQRQKEGQLKVNKTE